MVADVYLRTVATMDKLRETLRDEHSFLIQVSGAFALGSAGQQNQDCMLETTLSPAVFTASLEMQKGAHPDRCLAA